MKIDKTEKNRIDKIFSLLEENYDDAQIALEFESPFTLLIATILSAQCTDERVNKVTPGLFKKFPDAKAFASGNLEEIEKEIFSTGFYKAKAKNIKECCRMLVEKHGGKIPSNMDELTQLPGVGRKTSSVVLGNAFGVPAIAVDTHVKRLSNLLGIIDSDDAEKIEYKLMEILPEKKWAIACHWLMSHGRKICIARRPKCGECFLAKHCPSASIEKGKK